MVNPLVASSVDTVSPFSGAFLIEDGQALVEAIQSGNWVEGGIAGFSAVLDTAAAVVDPIGTLIANGLGWVLDHVEPLKGWLNDFTGDPGEVLGFAQTWRNVGTRMHDTADSFARRTHDLDGMSGETIDAYLAFAGDAVKHFHATGDWATVIGQGMEMASQLVQVVHDLVRDAISQVVGTAISVAAEMALTFGLATPAAITQITTKVGALATKVGRTITRLLAGFKKLSGLLDSLKALFTKSSGLLNNMLHGKSGQTTRPTEGRHSGPGRMPTREDFENYRDSLPTRGPNYGSSDARDFQRQHAGDTEYRISGDGGRVWADGLKYDPSTGGIAVEAKYVDNPGGSSIYEGTAPAFIREKVLGEFDEEIRAYVAAIADPSTPLTRLDIVVSTPAARDYLSARITDPLDELYRQTGTKIDWTIGLG